MTDRPLAYDLSDDLGNDGWSANRPIQRDEDNGHRVITWLALSLVVTVLFVCAVFLWGYQA